jgi:ribosomal protein S18 acetylase RimI-like enzyme
MEFTIRPMTLSDYNDAYSLWNATEGIDLDEEDDHDAFEIYLNRNQGLCFVANIEGKLVGTLLCGHEGRRGILRHLVVAPEYQNKGIARALINKFLDALAGAGIQKCNTFVLNSNEKGLRFWEHIGFHLHEDNFRLMQIPTKSDE